MLEAKEVTLYSSEGREMISQHQADLDTTEYRSICSAMRQACAAHCRLNSQAIGDFIELDEEVTKLVTNALPALSSSEVKASALEARIRELSSMDEWGDNMTLVAMVHRLDVSAKLFQVTTNADNDALVVVHPAAATIARPGERHFGTVREVMLLHSPSHWQAMLTLEQATAAGKSGPIVHCEGEAFMVFGIPPDNSCQFGAFVWAGHQQKLFSIADVLEPGEQTPDCGSTKTNSSISFSFLPASEGLLNSLATKLTHQGTKMLKRSVPEQLILRGKGWIFTLCTAQLLA